MILRFTIDHLRASPVVGTWFLARRLPGDIGRSAGDAVVRQVRREVAKALPSDQAYPLLGSEKRTARAFDGLALGLISGFGGKADIPQSAYVG